MSGLVISPALSQGGECLKPRAVPGARADAVGHDRGLADTLRRATHPSALEIRALIIGPHRHKMGSVAKLEPHKLRGLTPQGMIVASHALLEALPIGARGK